MEKYSVYIQTKLCMIVRKGMNSIRVGFQCNMTPTLSSLVMVAQTL